MPSFEDKTEELIRLLGSAASNVNARQGDRVFNYHYDPAHWAEMRALLPKMVVRLEGQGFSPQVHSFADIVTDILGTEGAAAMEAMAKAETTSKLPHKTYTATLQQLLTGQPPSHPLTLESPIVKRLLALLEQAAQTPKALLLLTDIEMLHPLIRVSAFEQVLQGKFLVPTIFFYPGRRGNIGDNPSYLGIYKSDGNYRSTHIY